MLKLPADVVLVISVGGGARKERESGGECLDSSDVLSLSVYSKGKNITTHVAPTKHERNSYCMNDSIQTVEFV
jgi:hypothetical protein